MPHQLHHYKDIPYAATLLLKTGTVLLVSVGNITSPGLYEKIQKLAFGELPGLPGYNERFFEPDRYDAQYLVVNMHDAYSREEFKAIATLINRYFSDMYEDNLYDVESDVLLPKATDGMLMDQLDQVGSADFNL